MAFTSGGETSGSSDPQRVGGDAQINNERLAHDVRPRQESPEAAVIGLVAVVAHDPVMPGRDRDRAPIVGRRMVASRVAPDVVGQVQGPDLPELYRIVGLKPEVRSEEHTSELQS